MTQPGTDEARLQREQLERYLAWVKAEGGQDRPTHLKTLFRPEQQMRLAWLRDHCEGSVLEVGCCYGFVLAYCDGQIGVDVSPHNIELARILNPTLVFQVGDARELPLQDTLVDTVMLPDCLEHLPWADVPRALAESLRVARKKVLITMPNGEYTTRTSALFKHQWILTESRLEALLGMLEGHIVRLQRDYYWVLLQVAKS